MEQINQRENQREMWQWNKKTKGKTKRNVAMEQINRRKKKGKTAKGKIKGKCAKGS